MSGEPNIDPPIKEMQLFWDGQLAHTYQFDVTGKTLSNMGWVRHTLLLPTATSNATALSFVGSTPSNNNGGPALDGLCLTAV